MTDPWTERLSDYIDGELSAPEQHQLETHLAACAECTSVLASLREVTARASSLVNTPPPTDLWPGIAARIGDPRASSMGAPVTAKRAATRRGLLDWLDRRFTITVPQAAAAAAVLVAVAGVTVWLTMGQRPATRPNASPGTSAQPQIASRLAPPPDTVEPTRVRDERGPASSSPATTASVAGFDPRYDATIAELQRVLAQERSRLDPETVKVLESNLKIIDRAVADARRAVESDPSNSYLRNHLASVMKRKADLLRQATLLADSQGSEG